MSRRVQLVLLCEDKQHEAFARRFLDAAGWDTRTIRVEKAPGGRGAAEQFVRQSFPQELKAHRSRPVDQRLVVIMDGDSEGVSARLQQLAEACRNAGVEERRLGEGVALFFPTWNIETWLAYLDGEPISEANPSYPRLSRERECRRHVDRLAEMCNAGKLREPVPDSLAAACLEYQELKAK